MDQRMYSSRETQAAIGRVLLTRRDPIGVADVPEASDEYDAYVGPVYHLLAAGASDEAIARHLIQVETTELGFEDSDWRLLVPVAHELRNAFRRSTSAPDAT